jgi:hypothetical protein
LRAATLASVVGAELAQPVTLVEGVVDPPAIL